MKKIYLFITLFTSPFFSFATEQTADTLMSNVAGWVSQISTIIFMLVILAFFYGLFLFMISDQKREKGKDIMLGGFIAIFVMSSIGGLVAFVSRSIFGNDMSTGDNTFDVPNVTTR